MADFNGGASRQEEEYAKAQSRANGYSRDQVTWRYILGVATAIIALSFAAMGWFINKGYENLMDSNKRIEFSQKEAVATFAKKCDEGETRDRTLAAENHKLERRVSGLEIWVTMPYSQRIKALEKLGGLSDVRR